MSTSPTSSSASKSRRVLISGSVAYDNLLVFEGRFKDHILPDHLHRLSVSFVTPQLKREFGGCAANIAYNLRLLGGEPVVLAAVGSDGTEYLEHMRGMGIDVSQVLQLGDSYTPQCFITTDLDSNQFTAFHPGAMSEAHRVEVNPALPAAFGIVGPNGFDAMLAHARGFREAQVPFIFDPGQGMPMFDGTALRRAMDGAAVITVNDYEAQMMAEKLGCTEADLPALAPVVIITRGADGSDVFLSGMRHHVPVAAATKVVDPTGCGDAYRGGLLFGAAQGWPWLKSAQLGSVLGAIKIESQGPQNHRPSREQIAERFRATYDLPLFD